MDHDSELYDHWENIREAERWFAKAETMTTSAAPEFYQLSGRSNPTTVVLVSVLESVRHAFFFLFLFLGRGLIGRY